MNAEGSLITVISTRVGVKKNEPYCMREREHCLWLLLVYARPGLDQFVAEDNTVVCKEQEHTEDDSKIGLRIHTGRDCAGYQLARARIT